MREEIPDNPQVPFPDFSNHIFSKLEECLQQVEALQAQQQKVQDGITHAETEKRRYKTEVQKWRDELIKLDKENKTLTQNIHTLLDEVHAIQDDIQKIVKTDNLFKHSDIPDNS